MNRVNGIKGCEQSENLGWITEAIGAGASIFNTVSNNRADRKDNESEERQLQLQLKAQELQNQSQMSSQERIAKTVKMVIIGGGVLLAGGVIISAIVRKKSTVGVGGVKAKKQKPTKAK